MRPCRWSSVTVAAGWHELPPVVTISPAAVGSLAVGPLESRPQQVSFHPHCYATRIVWSPTSSDSSLGVRANQGRPVPGGSNETWASAVDWLSVVAGSSELLLREKLSSPAIGAEGEGVLEELFREPGVLWVPPAGRLVDEDEAG